VAGTGGIALAAAGISETALVAGGASAEFDCFPQPATNKTEGQTEKDGLVHGCQLLASNRNVVVHRRHALDAFGNISSFVFLPLCIHESAQLAGSAIKVHVDLVEFVFGIVAQRTAHLALQRFVVDVLPGAARI
jgi:hypothetical protein